jgi:hypothetical protein
MKIFLNSLIFVSVAQNPIIIAVNWQFFFPIVVNNFFFFKYNLINVFSTTRI